MASPPKGSLADASTSQPYRQLDDGETFRARAARFWNHVQGLPPGDYSGNSALRRAPPLYSRARKFKWRENRGSAHRESRPQERKVQLRNRADDPGVPGFVDRQIPAGLFHSAFAVFRFAAHGTASTLLSPLFPPLPPPIFPLPPSYCEP